MKKTLALSLTLLIVMFSIFVTDVVNGQQVNGLEFFPLPSSAYKVGQVVAIYSKPLKVTIVWEPELIFPESATTDISSSLVKEGELKLKASLQSVVNASVQTNSKYKVNVEYSNAREIQPTITQLKSSLRKAWKNPANTEAVQDAITKHNEKNGLTRRPTHLDVLSVIYIADINAEITDEKGRSVELDAPILSKINASLDGSAKLKFASNGKAKGKSLPVGYQKEPQMFEQLLAGK